MSTDKREEMQISLVSQLGSDPKHLIRLEHDMRMLSYITEGHRYPSNFKRLLFLSVKARVMACIEKGLPYNLEEITVDEFLHLSLSIENKGRTHLIKGEQVMRGVPVSMESEIPPPGVMDRLFRKQKVEAYERQEAEKLNLT